ncbi:MAG: hypothetical protein JW934_13755 [Anaerolineae bacterium]|nr:hypothetical protein [Anaerolineae bacterium]
MLRPYLQIIREADPGSGERVLVGVMNDPRDWQIAQTSGWYRIPVERAPKRVGADYLAFYFTAAFAPDLRFTVAWYAPILAYRLLTRAELLPGEAAHPRAQARYFKLEIGPLVRLERPIPSRRLRRIAFIATTLERLLHAEEINDLWDKGTGQDALWAALKGAGLDAERQVEVNEAGVEYVADFVVGSLRVVCGEMQDGALYLPETALEDTAGCVRRIREALTGT